MSLIFANGESFAIGALQYSYGPATPGETTNRIIMPVEIEGELPSFIGLMGFLERIRFAIDPSIDTFYFGKF